MKNRGDIHTVVSFKLCNTKLSKWPSQLAVFVPDDGNKSDFKNVGLDGTQDDGLCPK
jgi:hypothetical protein